MTLAILRGEQSPSEEEMLLEDWGSRPQGFPWWASDVADNDCAPESGSDVEDNNQAQGDARENGVALRKTEPERQEEHKELLDVATVDAGDGGMWVNGFESEPGRWLPPPPRLPPAAASSQWTKSRANGN